MNSLSRQFIETVGSGQPLLLIRTDEPDDVVTDLSEVCHGEDYSWHMWTWDCDDGLLMPEMEELKEKEKIKPAGPANLAPTPPKVAGSAEVIGAIKTLLKLNNRDLDEGEDKFTPGILVLHNLHRFWQGNDEKAARVIQTLRNFSRVAKLSAKHIVGITVPGEMPPPELAPIFEILDHALPSKEERGEILSNIKMDDVDVAFDESDTELIAAAAAGTTREQAQTAYSKAFLRYAGEIEENADLAAGPFFASVVEEYKNNILNADGMLKRWHAQVAVDPHNEDGAKRPWPLWDDIGGNDAVKKYLMQVLRPESRKKRSKMNCALLVGPPGTGKTLLAKALGNATSRKTYGANLSSNKSKWVGDSEANARRMFQRASAMSNIVLYFDEINEQVEGGESDGHAVDKALRQYLMEWLDTHWMNDDVYVVMTANDISQMHMALTRPGRVDEIFYVGLPGKVQKQSIWQICIAQYGLGEDQTSELPNDEGWAGKEIEQCCKKADCFNVTLKEAGKSIIPSSIRVAEQIERLMKWADGRCLDAETGEMFRKDKAIPSEATGDLPRVKRKLRKI